MKYLILSLILFVACGGGTPTPPPAPLSASLPPEVPQYLRDLVDNKPTGITYHMDIQEACADNGNNGLFPTCNGGQSTGGKPNGPIKNFDGMWRENNPDGVALSPGDELLIHAGIYAPADCTPSTQTLSITFQGSQANPIRIRGEGMGITILEGGFDLDDFDAQGNGGCGPTNHIDDYHQVPRLRLGGQWGIIENLTIQGCYQVCVSFWSGYDFVWQEIEIAGGIEDGIKTTESSGRFLVWRGDFHGWAGGGEALDNFGADDTWYAHNTFHDNDRLIRPGVYGQVMWTKGGAHRVHIIENSFKDLIIESHALNLGGCCWNNWSPPGGKGNEPVATDVEALRNTFTNITFNPASTASYPGVLAVVGCWDCQAIGNTVVDSPNPFAVQATADNSNGWRVPPKNILFQDNLAVGIPNGRIVSATSLDELSTTTFSGNLYCLDESPTFSIKNESPDPMDWSAWQGRGFDTTSILATTANCPP